MRTLIIFLLSFLFFQLSAQEVQKYSTPKSGEGLEAFYKRNGINSTTLKAEFLNLNKSRLGKNNTLLIGVRYIIPQTSKYLYEPIYGSERERFEIESNQLQGAVFHLISGHGGPDPGALGKYGNNTISEDEYAYDITLRLAKKLQENGATVYMIIQDANDGIRDREYLPLDKDEKCMGKTIPLNQTQRLKQRSQAVNTLAARHKSAFQRCVVVHIDSRSKGAQIDVFFYHAPKSKSGERAANSILKVFDSKYSQHQPSRGYSGSVDSRRLYVLQHTNPPAVFVELGNIKNSRDLQRFISPNNRQALANWMYEGLLLDYKNSK